MRRAVVAIVWMGCWNAPPPPAPRAPARIEPARLPAPSAVRTARIRVDPATWIDIAIDGGAERAEVLCDLAVTEAMRIGQVVPEARVVRPCAPDPLPRLAARSGSVLLVQREELDEERFTIPLMARLTQPTQEQPAHGATTTYTWMADRLRCSRAAGDLQATIAAVRREQQEAARSFVSAQLDTARRDEAKTCDEARNLAVRCTQVQPDMRGVCGTIAREAARGCQQAHDRIVVLERQLADRPDVPATRTVRCTD